MLQKYNTKAVYVCDSGIYLELAIMLSRYFGKVFYTSPWIEPYPVTEKVDVGEGIANVTKVEDFHDIIDETDLFVFPDNYFSGTQNYLQGIGKRVWGSRDGEELELYRDSAKKYFDELGIPQGPYQIIKGLEKLRSFLEKSNKKPYWVKTVGKRRGDKESFFVRDYWVFENELDDYESRVGPAAQKEIFVVEDHVEAVTEIAADTICIDDQFPKTCLLGVEEKDRCYIGVRKQWFELPMALRSLYERLSDTMKEYKYRNSFALETAVLSRTEMLLRDPCCRFGSPVFELQTNMIKNWPDIFWYGAEGKLIEPEMPDKYGAILLLSSTYRETHPLAVDFPPELRDKIKFSNMAEYDGKTWVMPVKDSPIFAAVVESGNSLDGVIEKVRKYSDKIVATQVKDYGWSLDFALKSLDKLKEMGISV